MKFWWYRGKPSKGTPATKLPGTYGTEGAALGDGRLVAAAYAGEYGGGTAWGTVPRVEAEGVCRTWAVYEGRDLWGDLWGLEGVCVGEDA